jgi:8-oxo-dGTP pyrophosphatase MutT (NUDIX family)
MSETRELGKVTLFVLRQAKHGRVELALFRHPYAGIQFPAGTVEPNEESEAAALREAREETGFTSFSNLRLMGSREEPAAEGQATILTTTPVYMRPNAVSPNWARLPRGTNIEVLREENDFAQVNYQETDQLIGPRYVAGQILGWVPKSALTRIKRRYFYAMDYSGESPDQWSLVVDENPVTVFWAPLHALPEIVTPQDEWARYLAR